MSSKQKQSYMFAALAILSWSTVSTAFKFSLVHFSPIGLLLISSSTACIFLGLYVLISTKDPFADFLQNLSSSILPGFLNPFLYYMVLFIAYDRLRAQEAQALNYTWAIVLSLLSVLLLKERFRIRDLVALIVSLFGVVIISTKGQILRIRFDDGFGTALALGSSLIWAAYWILNLKDKRPNPIKLFYNFLIGFILIGATAGIFRSQILLPDANKLTALTGGIWVGIFEMGLTFILWLKALQLTENTAKISNMIFITPFISMIFISSILGESIHPATLAGLVLIVGSNILQKS